MTKGKIIPMHPSKETVGKLRWSAIIDGVTFNMYIPKERVPQPWPARIEVVLSEKPSGRQPTQEHSRAETNELERPIIATVEKDSEHTKTVKYRPIGPDDEWEIGEPYVPFALLPEPVPERLRVEVRWDRSAGSWRDWRQRRDHR